MEDLHNYKDVNKHLWNEKTEAHVNSEFYDNKSFIEGRNSLNPAELALLGNVNGKNILHLQCHFGQDTLSLARMGAKCTGLDLSDKAIDTAIKLNQQLKLNVEFICSDVYSAPESLNEKFDIVFTSYGTIGWLPDLNKWAEVIKRCLKPGGKLVMVDFHPVVWMFDYNFSKFNYSYFNTGAIVETNEGTYADKKADIKAKEISWNHPISEILEGLLNNNLSIDSFNEYDYSPYNCFNNTIEISPNNYQIKGLEGIIPMLYSIEASK